MLQFVPHPADQMAPKCTYRDQDPLGKLAKRSQMLLFKRLETSIVNCIRSFDFRLLWVASEGSRKLYFHKYQVTIEYSMVHGPMTLLISV
jgi:hypothetical protein